ncbi:MAG: cytochrome ubiquinol oxidase subunit I [Nitrosotalea sp.]
MAQVHAARGQCGHPGSYLEVFAFFGESILIATYVYSRHKFSNRYIHVAIMGLVCIFAVMSAVMITTLNAFMNTPSGFDIEKYLATGQITEHFSHT